MDSWNPLFFLVEKTEKIGKACFTSWFANKNGPRSFSHIHQLFDFGAKVFQVFSLQHPGGCSRKNCWAELFVSTKFMVLSEKIEKNPNDEQVETLYFIQKNNCAKIRKLMQLYSVQ